MLGFVVQITLKAPKYTLNSIQAQNLTEPISVYTPVPSISLLYLQPPKCVAAIFKMATDAKSPFSGKNPCKLVVPGVSRGDKIIVKNLAASMLL